MTVVFTERYPASPSTVRAARHDVSEALTATGFSDPDLQSQVALALSEATGNVVRHAYPYGLGDGHMEVVVTETTGAISIAVTDYGVGMNGADPRCGLPSLGLGLSLMRSQSSSMGVESDTNGTIVTLHFEGSRRSA
jgi:anti-sigma regulatory factor (Ser/Thr protein kinase)